MKKVLLFSFIALIIGVFTSCKKEKQIEEEKKEEIKEEEKPALVVDEKQRSMVGYVTATWCGPCGQYGGPALKAAIINVGTAELIPLNFQTSSSRLTPYFMKPGVTSPDSVFIAPIVSPIFASLNIPTNANGGFSIPAFSMNNTYMGTSNVTSDKLTTNTNTYNQNKPVVGVVAKKTITGNMIKVDVKSKFFQEGNGEYHWVVLVVEKETIGYQLVGATPVEDYKHPYNVRASMQDGEMHTQKLWGNSFASGNISVGSEFEKSFSLNYVDMTVNPNFKLIEWKLNPDNTAIAVMVWKKIGTKYEYMNGFIAD